MMCNDNSSEYCQYAIHTLGAIRMSPVPIFGKILRRVYLLKNTLALATRTCTLRSEIVFHNCLPNFINCARISIIRSSSKV